MTMHAAILSRTVLYVPYYFEFKMLLFYAFSEQKVRVCLRYEVLFFTLSKPQKTKFSLKNKWPC